jgi:hypothetical protein
MSTTTTRKRTNMSGAVMRLAESPRTIRDMAARGEIPGAAKIRGTWSFDIASLEALVAEKEREICQNSVKPHRVVSGARASSTAAYRPAAQTSSGHYALTITRSLLRLPIVLARPRLHCGEDDLSE